MIMIVNNIIRVYYLFTFKLFAEFMQYKLKLFQNELFQKILSGALSECQIVWIQIRTYILLVLIWVQTVYNGYQQMTNVTASKEVRDSLIIEQE